MKNTIKLLGIIAFAVVIGFSITACGGESPNDGGKSGSGPWVTINTIVYTVTDGEVVSIYSQTRINWIRYKNETDYEFTYGSGASSGATRNGETYVHTLGTTTSTFIYDLATGLILKQTQTNGSRTTETSCTIELISDAGGIKTYKYYVTDTGGTGTYQEYKIKNGRTLERKDYTATGALNMTLTYTYPDNAVLHAKVPNYSFYRTDYPSQPARNTHQTFEIVSDSDSELVVRQKTFNADNVLTGQQDQIYKPISVLLQQ